MQNIEKDIIFYYIDVENGAKIADFLILETKAFENIINDSKKPFIKMKTFMLNEIYLGNN